MTAYGKLTRRAEFAAARKGRRMETGALTIQAVRPPASGPQRAARFGLTVTKKTGNAVERNRIKRRLRAMLRALPATLPDTARPAGCDFVLIARRDVLHRPFATLLAETGDAVQSLTQRLHRPGGRQRGPGPSQPPSARLSSAPPAE